MKTQQADRVAQESAVAIDLTRKQIEQYDVDAKQREADEASSKAFTTLAGGIYSDGFTQEDLMAGLQGLNSSDAVRALNIYNERNPGDMLEKVEIGGRTFVTNRKSGATFDLGTGSELDKETESRIAAINQMNIPEEQKQEMIQQALNYAATPRDRDGYPIDGFGGQPAGGAAAGGGAAGVPIAPTETENVLFERLPDNIFTEGNMVDPDVLEAELAKMDFLSPQEAERMRQLAAQESVNRRRKAYLEATGEKPEDTSRSTQEMVGQGRVAGGSFANPYEFLKGLISGRNPTTKAPPDPRLQSIQQARAIQESPISAPTTSRGTQEIIGEARAIQGLPSEVQLQDRALKQRQAAFDNAKELARQELAKKLSGPERDKVLKELDDARIDEIMSLKGKSAQTKTQKKVREALLNILRGPEFIRKYGIDELPGKLLDLIPDMRTKRERERLERLEKQTSK